MSQDSAVEESGVASVEAAAVGATIIANKEKLPPTQHSFLDKPHPEAVANKTKLIHPSKLGWNSEVWRYFHIFETNPDGSKYELARYACCNKCGAQLIATRSDGSKSTQGSVKQHIMTHGFVLGSAKRPFKKTGSDGENEDGDEDGNVKKLKETKQTTMQQAFGPSLRKFKSRDNEKESNMWSICRCILANDLPFSIVESPAWRAMPLSSTVIKMSRKMVVEMMMRKQHEIRCELKLQMKGQLVALTIDHWTSQANQNYTGLTAHFINSNWELVSLDLGCFLHEGHTAGADVLEGMLVNLVVDCGFEELNVIAVVSDSAANMVSFGRMIESAQIPHVCCTDHIIQLTAKLAFGDDVYGDSPLSPMSKVRGLVGHFTGSTQAMEALKSQQGKMDGFKDSAPLVVFQDVVTRWWATWRMLDRVIHLKPVLNSLLLDNKLPESKWPDDKEWKIYVQMRNILKPFAEAQRTLEGEKYVTSSLVLPTILHLGSTLKDAVTDAANSDETLVAAKALFADYKTRWRWEQPSKFSPQVIWGYRQRQVGVHPALFFATLLDPRFKLLDELSQQDKVGIKEAMVKVMVNHIVDGPNALAADLVAAPAPAASADRRLMFLTRRQQQPQAQVVANPITPKQKCEEELERYLNAMNLPLEDSEGEENDPLLWWKKNEEVFPILAKLARIYLAIPATSAPTERIFSKASLVINRLRSRLTPANAGMAIFLKSNLEWHEQLQESRNNY